MSNSYARLVEQLATTGPTVIQSGIEVRHVRVIDGGYAFEARLFKEWCLFTTSEDLPAFTDRGRAQRADRALRVHPKLRTGRPPVADHGTPIGVRLTDPQRKWLEEQAGARGLAPSAYVRAMLQRRGMP